MSCIAIMLKKYNSKHLIYFFGNGKADGSAKMKDILGGKGAGLAEMTNLGIPVPAGFTISTELCKYFYENNKQYPKNLREEVEKNIQKLEKTTGKVFGSNENPLLVSVRSGASVSMPGMMDTILNLGVNDNTIQGLIKQTKNERFAYDTYRRFIQMFGNVVKNIPIENFDNILKDLKKSKNYSKDTELSVKDLKEIIAKYKEVYKKYTKSVFPQEPKEQLFSAIDAVLMSWMNERAIKYREINNIKNIAGTAVNIQSMVFGNYGDNSGTGVCFSRNPTNGEREIYGEYLQNAQGEDVVAGIRTPMKISTLQEQQPNVYKQLEKVIATLEKHYKDMQDIEFTVCNGELFLLQTRVGKRTSLASIKMAVDMVKEKLITKEEAIMRVLPDQISKTLHPIISKEEKEKANCIAVGLNACIGCACGKIAYTAQEAEKRVKNGEKVILVRQNTSPEDLAGMVVAEGILTATGGVTSHAAIVSRGLGKPCVICAGKIVFENEKVFINGKEFVEGDFITIDGATGEVFEGQLPLITNTFNKDVDTFLNWCDEICEKSVRKTANGVVKGFSVLTNADRPEDTQTAINFGAKGIGLCRTEHMFFDKDKIMPFRAMIVSDNVEMREKYLQQILPLQQKDFEGMFKILDGKSVIIRLLDPPLHEFVPKTEEETKHLAEYINCDLSEMKQKLSILKEANPMMGHRGCRLALTYPEIYAMQVEAICNAVKNCNNQGIDVNVKIMIPIVCEARELAFVRNICEKVIDKIMSKNDKKIPIGTMIEVPRSALLADEVAEYADFFSFGTNDLTQMTFGFSRDDVNKLMNTYFSTEILQSHPFKTIDVNGVGKLIEITTEKGRKTKNELSIGVCGEQGGDPESIDFCYKTGLNYVSCSPFRVPVARLATAQAVIRNK